MGTWPITHQQVVAARDRIRPHLSPTPLRAYDQLDRLVGQGIRVLVKHENHNPTNAFKARNALSVMTTLSPEQIAKGVIAATRGNHGQAVGWAGALVGAPVTICVPANNNPDKNEGIRAFGGALIEQGRDFDDALALACRLAKEKELRLIHSVNDPEILAGAGTITLEILEQHPEVEAVVVGLGAGTQAVGAMTVTRALRPEVEVYAVQSSAASTIYDSWRCGQPRPGRVEPTIAEGLATRDIYDMTFEPLCESLADFVTVTDTEIAEAIRILLRTTHNLAEGAGAAPLAGLFKLREKLAGKTVALVFSGGNLDLLTLTRVLQGEL